MGIQAYNPFLIILMNLEKRALKHITVVLFFFFSYFFIILMVRLTNAKACMNFHHILHIYFLLHQCHAKSVCVGSFQNLLIKSMYLKKIYFES